MVNEAEAHAEDDKAKRDLVQARNNLDNLVYSTEKLINEKGETIEGFDRGPVDTALTEAKSVLANATAGQSEIQTALDNLTKLSHELSSKLYESQKNTGGDAGAAGSEPPPSGGADKSGDDVIDADYKDVNKE